MTIPSKNTHPACKKNNIDHSDIVDDHSLGPGIDPRNYTLLGQVPNMGDCMALCCSSVKRCTIAYMKNNTCYGVSCYDLEKCSVANSTLATPEHGTQLALIIRNDMNRRIYVTTYLVVVVVAFAAAMSGTIWAVGVFYKRYSTFDRGQEDDAMKKKYLPVSQHELQEIATHPSLPRNTE